MNTARVQELAQCAEAIRKARQAGFRMRVLIPQDEGIIELHERSAAELEERLREHLKDETHTTEPPAAFRVA